jgi:hypothetical protein
MEDGMPTWELNFLLGAVGGLAPEVVRHVNLARRGQEFTWSWYLLIASVLYAGLAGLIAAILPSANLYAAFYSGLTTDVFISKATRAAAGTEKRKKAAKANKSNEPVAAPRRLSPLDSFLDAL